MSWVAAGVGAAGIATNVVGGMMGGGAAKKAAQAQQAAAQQWMDFVGGQEDKAIGMVRTPSALAAHDQALQSQEKTVQQQEQLASSINPNMIDVGKQLHGLLNGQSAPILSNIQNQRNLQRQALQDKMNTQMGPGGATSTAGMQALNQFDNDTSNMMANAQQSYTEDFLKTSLQAPSVLNALGQTNKDLATINSMSPDAQAADLMAKFTGAQGQAAGAMVNAAGGQYLGQQIQGQMIGNVGSALTQFGAAAAGRQMFGGSTPTPSGGGSTGLPQLQPVDIGSSYNNNQNYGLGLNGDSGMVAAADKNAGSLGSSIMPTSVNYNQAPIWGSSGYKGANPMRLNASGFN